MKTLKKLKLNQLSKADLDAREMNELKGGLCCGCGCHGSSSTHSNQNANALGGYTSIGGDSVCWCWNGSNWDQATTV